MKDFIANRPYLSIGILVVLGILVSVLVAEWAGVMPDYDYTVENSIVD